MGVQHLFETSTHRMAGEEALVKVSSIHRYAAQQFAATLAHMQHGVQTGAGVKSLAPTQALLLDGLNHELLWSLLTVVQKGGVNITDALKHHKPLTHVEIQIYRQIDQLDQLYLQNVQTILRR